MVIGFTPMRCWEHSCSGIFRCEGNNTSTSTGNFLLLLPILLRAELLKGKLWLMIGGNGCLPHMFSVLETLTIIITAIIISICDIHSWYIHTYISSILNHYPYPQSCLYKLQYKRHSYVHISSNVWWKTTKTVKRTTNRHDSCWSKILWRLRTEAPCKQNVIHKIGGDG